MAGDDTASDSPFHTPITRSLKIQIWISKSCVNSWTELVSYPLPSLSKTRKASRSSSSLSVSFIFFAIMLRNSSKSIVPLPSHTSTCIPVQVNTATALTAVRHGIAVAMAPSMSLTGLSPIPQNVAWHPTVKQTGRESGVNNCAKIFRF